MASDSSAGFHHQQQQRGGLYRPGGATSSSSSGGSGGCELISMGNNYSYGRGGGMNLGGNECPSGRMLFGAQNSLDSSLTHVLDSFPGLKHDTGFAVEWSMDEQYKLEEGLAKYASEPHIIKYIKIAASLRDKTVRDVALRCRWMMRKRRKHEHPFLGKKVKDQKETSVEPTLKNNMTSASSVNVAPYSSTASQQCGYLLSGVLSGPARHLLEDNSQAFEQISVNLSTHKLQQNVDLFFRVRNNIVAVLDSMRKTPGIMSQMPPLPVLLNEELTSSIFPPSSQPMMFCPSSLAPVKQEPGF